MIYEQINDIYDSLANKWHDLAEAFRRLASTEQAGSPRRAVLEGQPGQPGGLAFDCDHPTLLGEGDVGGYSQRIQTWSRGPRTGTGIKTAIKTAIVNLQCHENFRGIIKRSFIRPDMFPERPTERVEVLGCREQLEELRLYIADNIQKLQEITTPNITVPASLSGLRDTVDGIASYPMLTSEVGGSAPFSTFSGSRGGGGPNPLQRTIDDAVRDVLGHLPRTKDTRSFMQALNQSFQVTEVEGHTEVAWVQRSYTGQTDLGDGITGGQASLYTRSKVALENALPLLDGLYPLLPDYDAQLAQAARSIVHSELVELVSELGVEGGPRVARVDQLFRSLLLTQNTHPDPNEPPIDGGHLGYLKVVLGLLPDQVNTLEEERDVTNFIAFREYITCIQTGWENFRKEWLGKDLGTRLVQLSRTLSVTAETVNEVRFAMDSVSIGPAERQVVSFHDQNGNEVLVDELLSWVADFAGEEAPNLVHDAGKRGAAAIIPTGQLLSDLVACFISQIPHDPDLPAGLRHRRVLPPLRELQSYLQRVVNVAQDINRPVSAI